MQTVLIDMASLWRGRINRIDFIAICLMLKAIDLIEDYSYLLYFPHAPWTFLNMPLYYAAWGVFIIVTYLKYSMFAKRIRDIGYSSLFILPVFILEAVAFAVRQNQGILDNAFGGNQSLFFIESIVFVICYAVLAIIPGEKNDNKYGSVIAKSMFAPHITKLIILISAGVIAAHYIYTNYMTYFVYG